MHCSALKELTCNETWQELYSHSLDCITDPNKCHVVHEKDCRQKQWPQCDVRNHQWLHCPPPPPPTPQGRVPSKTNTRPWIGQLGELLVPYSSISNIPSSPPPSVFGTPFPPLSSLLTPHVPPDAALRSWKTFSLLRSNLFSHTASVESPLTRT